jgi:hypothetical protein
VEIRKFPQDYWTTFPKGRNKLPTVDKKIRYWTTSGKQQIDQLSKFK